MLSLVEITEKKFALRKKIRTHLETYIQMPNVDQIGGRIVSNAKHKTVVKILVLEIVLGNIYQQIKNGL